MKKLTRQDRQEILYLAGCALQGILADHQQHQRFHRMGCAKSSCRWAVSYAVETHKQLKKEFRKPAKFTFPPLCSNYRSLAIFPGRR